MGLGRPVRLPTKVILAIDSSIQEGSKYAEYEEGLYADESLLRLDPADPPVRWNIRQLTAEQKDAMEAQATPRERAKMAIRCSLIGIEGYRIEKPDGGLLDMSKPDTVSAGKLGAICTEKWVNALNLPVEQLTMLYMALQRFSEASLPLSKPLERPPGEPCKNALESEPSP